MLRTCGGVGGGVGGGGGDINHRIQHGVATTQKNALGKHITVLSTAICPTPPLPLNDHRVRRKHGHKVLQIANKERKTGCQILFPMVQNKKVAYGDGVLNSPPAQECKTKPNNGLDARHAMS